MCDLGSHASTIAISKHSIFLSRCHTDQQGLSVKFTKKYNIFLTNFGPECVFDACRYIALVSLSQPSVIFGGLGTVFKLRFRNLVSLDRGLSLYRSLVWALLSFLSIKKSNSLGILT